MSLEIRPVTADEHEAAWRVLQELRTHLTREAFDAALAHQTSAHEYELIGAYENGELLGVLGMRALHTFARGPHLHVDDLVVAAGSRGRGVGRRLLRHAEKLARQRGLTHVFLDSRVGAIGFYESDGYRRHDSVLIRKRLGKG